MKTAIAVLILMLVPLQLMAGEACLSCHDETETVLHVSHRAEDISCTNCHGASNLHLESRTNRPDVVFGSRDSSPDSENSQCLQCHDNSGRTHWPASIHNLSALSCSSCHTAHSEKDPILVKNKSQAVCLECHTEMVAQLHLPSRHPIREGKTTCLDCHASHGSLAERGELKSTSVNESCIGCHSEKRGPFLFEHDPVAEDCLLCHKPHGSTQPALLVARPPFLCQQCHLASGHPSRAPDGRSLLSGSSNMAAGSCLNCHSAVHGSNHPSGARLTK